MSNDQRITQVVAAAARGAGEPAEHYRPVYEELRRIARANRRRWRGNDTLNTTALIHEAFLRMAGTAEWSNRVHFFATAAKAMRQILINYAERRAADKRGGGVQHLSADEFSIADPESLDELLELESALQVLERTEPRQAQIVECRFFAGMSIAETAEALDISPATVKRDWLLASASLAESLGQAGTGAR